MCLEEMKCRTSSTFFLLSSLLWGGTKTPSSTTPADQNTKRKEKETNVRLAGQLDRNSCERPTLGSNRVFCLGFAAKIQQQEAISFLVMVGSGEM